jgi:protoporphyrinogen oxidase/putative flippase GtrA
MSKLAVIGAGSMGLAAAYYASRQGHQVVVYEADDRAGGMAAHFDFDGLSIERYYHFICKADQPLFELLRELELEHALRWHPTSMGYYYQGRLYPWGDPFSLLRFPHVGLLGKLRYGLHTFISTRRLDWSKLDTLRADQWIRAWIGEEAYDHLWRRLFELKFFEYSDNLSAAWIWSRVKRVGTSRRSLLQEELGYLEGGSETLIKRLMERVTELGVEVRLSAPVQEITIEQGRVTGVFSRGVHERFEAVISTVPLPHVPRMIPSLPAPLRARYEALKNIGVVCVVHKLRKPVTPHFWVNVVDDRCEIPGIIEFTNLRPMGDDHVVYIPYYMPQNHPKFSRDEDFFIQETKGYLQFMNPSLRDEDFISARIGRLRFAQPICHPRFRDSLPPIQTEIAGLQIVDTSYYYPEDRSISESVRVGKAVAEASSAPAMLPPPPPQRSRLQFMRFLAAGGLAAGINVGCRVLLSYVLSYGIAVVLAYVCGMVTAFFLNRSFVFSPASLHVRKQFARFALVNLFALSQVWLVSVGLAEWVFPRIHFTYYPLTVAHVAGVLAPVFASYLGHKHFSFGPDPDETAPSRT